MVVLHITPFKVPRLTKQVAEEYISQELGVPINLLKFEKLTELPSMWRHACKNVGVVIMKPTILHYGGGFYQVNMRLIPNEEGLIHFILCNCCGKVVYYIDSKETLQ